MNNKQKMSVTLFSVIPNNDSHTLEHVLELIHSMPLENRLRQLSGGRQIRIETVERPTTRKPYWLLDFTRLRFEHGPGRASPRKPVQGFDLADGDGFGEETAVLYVPKSNHLVMQYNQFGVRHGAMEAYFSMIDPDHFDGFEIVPSLDPLVEAKLAKADLFSRLTLRIAPARVSESLRKKNVSLSRALEIAEQFGAPQLEISLSVGHTKASLGKHAVRGAINFAQRLLASDAESITHASVVGKDSDDAEAKAEVLDLITPRLKVEFDDLELGSDLRFTQRSRFRALERAYAGWRGIIEWA